MPAPLRWYAETPARRGRQIAADLVVVLLLLGCAWLGWTVHGLVSELAAPGADVESAGAGLAAQLDEAGAAANGLPVVGDELGLPLTEAAEASREIAAAGQRQQDVVGTLATLLGWLAGGLPALALVLAWLPRRLRSASRARIVSALGASATGIDLLALRALTRQPLSTLARLDADVAEGWRRRDAAVIEQLAQLELRQEGVVAPRASRRA